MSSISWCQIGKWTVAEPPRIPFCVQHRTVDSNFLRKGTTPVTDADRAGIFLRIVRIHRPPTSSGSVRTRRWPTISETPFDPDEYWDGEEEEGEEEEWDGQGEEQGEDEEYEDYEDDAFLIVEEEALVAVERGLPYRGCLVIDT